MRKNVKKTRGKPFEPGNPGRPKGARNKTTLAVEALLDGEAELLARKAVEMALNGDTTAMRLCLERICPPRRERSIACPTPTVVNPQDTVQAIGTVIAAVTTGEITPSEGQAVASLLDTQRKIIESSEIEQRLRSLEQRLDQN